MKDRQSSREEPQLASFALLVPSKYKDIVRNASPSTGTRCRRTPGLMGPRPQGGPGISHNVALYVERLLVVTLTAFLNNRISVAVRAPTRRHPSRHTLTSLSRRTKFGGVASEPEAFKERFQLSSLSSAAISCRTKWLCPSHTVMQPTDPNMPLFEVYVGEQRVALLHDPKRIEMFWCSYRVVPASDESERILRDEAIWSDVKFTVRAKDGRAVPTFTGGDFVMFCKRETDRISFRSLWPIDS